MESWFNSTIFFTYDRQLVLVDLSSGITNIGFPIQDKLDDLDHSYRFMRRISNWLILGDHKNLYMFNLNRNEWR